MGIAIQNTRISSSRNGAVTRKSLNHFRVGNLWNLWILNLFFVRFYRNYLLPRDFFSLVSFFFFISGLNLNQCLFLFLFLRRKVSFKILINFFTFRFIVITILSYFYTFNALRFFPKKLYRIKVKINEKSKQKFNWIIINKIKINSYCQQIF